MMIVYIHYINVYTFIYIYTWWLFLHTIYIYIHLYTFIYIYISIYSFVLLLRKRRRPGAGSAQYSRGFAARRHAQHPAAARQQSLSERLSEKPLLLGWRREQGCWKRIESMELNRTELYIIFYKKKKRREEYIYL